MTARASRQARTVGLVCISALSLLLAACGGGSSTSTGTSAANFTFMALNENTTQAAVLQELAGNECKTENAAQPLKITKQAQASVDQQIQLLAGQGALPQLFPANTPSLITQLGTAGQIADVSTVLAGTDAADAIVPAAASSIKSLYGGKEYVLPAELNIEGLWYDKKILADHGIAVPTTWDELVAAFATLKAAGVQPISQAGSGGDGWGVTRWVGMYLYRELGTGALQNVADGKAKLTDPAYAKAAQAVSDLGAAGYFGKAPTSIDYSTALNTFMTGGSAFIYMGSWALAGFNDAKQATIGADAIGFMAFPTVTGGTGSADQYPVNTGASIAVSSAAAKDAKSKAWIACIAKNYGTVALAKYGQITGFTSTAPADTPALTKSVQDTIAATTTSVLWFEALFSAQGTTVSQQSGGKLAAGDLTGQKFMATVQAQLG